MKIDFILLSDYAVDAAGKPTVVGVFDTVSPKGDKPARLSSLGIVFRLSIAAGERITTESFALALRSPSGKQVFELTGKLHAAPSPMVKLGPGDDYTVSFANTIYNVELPEEGKHTVQLSLANGERASTPLWVRRSAQ